MPNWCNNNITISGPKDQITKLWERATAEDGGLLSAMVPRPAILDDTTSPAPADLDPVLRETMIAQTGYDNWYDWCVSRWGTKWDVDTEGLVFEEDGDDARIVGYFDSAWAPPTMAYETFTSANPDIYIEATYFEGGMDFGGTWNNDEGDDYMDSIYSTYKAYKNNLNDAPGLFTFICEEYNLIEQYEEWDEDEEEVA